MRGIVMHELAAHLEGMLTSVSEASARMDADGCEVQVEAMEGSGRLLAPERGGQSDEGF